VGKASETTYPERARRRVSRPSPFAREFGQRTIGIVLDNASSEAISPRGAVIPGGAPDNRGARLHCDDSRDLSDIVIYPATASQRQRIEDLRLGRFT
jgi:hypothetical protein